MGDGGARHLEPLVDGQERRLAGVPRDPDHDLVEHRARPAHDVEVPERHRVERAGAHGDGHGVTLVHPERRGAVPLRSRPRRRTVEP
jgi:hypothetical protein